MARLIIKARSWLSSLSRKDFAITYLTIMFAYFEWLMQGSEHLQFALLVFQTKFQLISQV